MITKLTLVLSRGSVELRTPISPNEGLVFYDMLSRTDNVPYQSTEGSRSKEIPPPKQSLDHGDHSYPPIGGFAFLARAPFPSECPINSISSIDACERTISHAIGSEKEEEAPSCPAPQSSPPKHERETRRTSLMLRPVSLSGPVPQGLYPPPAKVRFPTRRGVIRPLPSPQSRSRQSIRHSPPPYESTHNVSQPGSPISLTPEEGLIQIQVRTRQTDHNLPAGYRRSFAHVRALNARALPTPPLPSVRPIRPLPLPPITTLVTDYCGNLSGADIRSQCSSSTKLVSPASPGASEHHGIPPDTVLDIASTWCRNGSSPVSKHSWSCARAREDKCVSTFLDLNPSAVQTPLSPNPPNVVY
jgi:hypothetical protein